MLYFDIAIIAGEIAGLVLWNGGDDPFRFIPAS